MGDSFQFYERGDQRILWLCRGGVINAIVPFIFRQEFSPKASVGSKLNCPVYVARHLSGFLIEFYMGFSCLRVCGGGG